MPSGISTCDATCAVCHVVPRGEWPRARDHVRHLSGPLSSDKLTTNLEFLPFVERAVDDLLQATVLLRLDCSIRDPRIGLRLLMMREEALHSAIPADELGVVGSLLVAGLELLFPYCVLEELADVVRR
jgi:hypothetical protein